MDNDDDEGEEDGEEEPDVDELEVWSTREVFSDLAEEGAKDEQGREGDNNAVLEVEPLEAERGEGNQVDQRRRDEDRDQLLGETHIGC